MSSRPEHRRSALQALLEAEYQRQGKPVTVVDASEGHRFHLRLLEPGVLLLSLGTAASDRELAVLVSPPLLESLLADLLNTPLVDDQAVEAIRATRKD